MNIISLKATKSMNGRIVMIATSLIECFYVLKKNNQIAIYACHHTYRNFVKRRYQPSNRNWSTWKILRLRYYSQIEHELPYKTRLLYVSTFL